MGVLEVSKPASENRRLAIQHHAAQVITGEIMGITERDTVKLLTANKQQIKIRLTESGTPEQKQP